MGTGLPSARSSIGVDPRPSDAEERAKPNPAPEPAAPNPKAAPKPKAQPGPKPKPAPKPKAKPGPKAQAGDRTGCGRASVGQGLRGEALFPARRYGVCGGGGDERVGRTTPPHYTWLEPSGERRYLYVELTPAGGYLVHGLDGDVCVLFDPLEFEAARDAAGQLAEEFAAAAGCPLKRAYKRALPA